MKLIETKEEFKQECYKSCTFFGKFFWKILPNKLFHKFFCIRTNYNSEIKFFEYRLCQGCGRVLRKINKKLPPNVIPAIPPHIRLKKGFI